MAIAEAINMAILRLRMMVHQYTRAEVYILSDSASGLEFLIGKEGLEEASHHVILRPLRGFITRACRELTTGLNARLRISFIPGHRHNIGGHILADKMAYAAYFIGCKKGEQPNPTAATSQKVISDTASTHHLPGATEGSLVAPTTSHCSIWAVLHHRSVRALADFEEHERLRRGQPMSSKQEARLRRLIKILALPKRAGDWRVQEVKSLVSSVGQFLSVSDREKARFMYNA